MEEEICHVQRQLEYLVSCERSDVNKLVNYTVP